MSESALKKSSDDVGETVSIWANPACIRRRFMQNTRNALKLGITCTNFAKGDSKCLAKCEATAINGIEKHVSSDNSICKGFCHGETSKSKRVAA